MLSVEISDLKDNAFDLSTLGFTDDELDKLMGLPDDASEDDFDLSTALEKAAFVEYGDIWTLGRHRLMCGDATIAADVDKLMGGKKANLCVTDIPYGVNFKSSSGLSIENDNLKGEEFYDFLLAAFTNIANALDKTGSVYVFHADSNGLVTRRAFDDAGLKLAETCIWVKNSQVLGHADYMYSHESILYGWRKDGRHKFFGDRTQKTVWNFDKPKKSENHPNAKPVELMALPVKNSSQANGIVIDLFAGGGSTLIACEQLNRACFMMELDPKYASLILRRYAEFTGNAGEDISVVRNGETIGYKELVKDVENS
jgi:DNA modification methylase